MCGGLFVDILGCWGRHEWNARLRLLVELSEPNIMIWEAKYRDMERDVRLGIDTYHFYRVVRGRKGKAADTSTFPSRAIVLSNLV